MLLPTCRKAGGVSSGQSLPAEQAGTRVRKTVGGWPAQRRGPAGYKELQDEMWETLNGQTTSSQSNSNGWQQEAQIGL